MAQTVKAYSPASGTVVFTAHNAIGQYWNGSAFATYSAGSIASYAIAATSLGGGWYSASLDNAATSYDLRLRAGGSLATTDPVVDAYSVIPITAGTGTGQIDLETGRVKPADSSLDPATPTADFAAQFIADMTDSTKAEVRAAILNVLTYLNTSGGSGSGSVSDIN